MSFVHPHFLGFFNGSVVEQGKLLLCRPLDMELAAGLLKEAAERIDGRFFYIGGNRFTLEDGM